ncbi:MAG: hypothetical protein ABSG22_09455 [Sedimentisphaerales bacterium]|jgi:hypothetical protein
MGQIARKLKYLALFGGLLVSGLAMRAIAHDIIPPDWRGQDGSTYQMWTFSNNGNPVLADVMQNEYGQAEAKITIGAYGSGWWNQLLGLGTQTGYWDLGGSGGRITIHIDNQPQLLLSKEIWIQVTYFKDISEVPTVQISGATYVAGTTVVVEQVQTGGAWYLAQSLWRISPSPSQEEIIINSDPNHGSVIDQIVVDTRVINCMVDFDKLSRFCEEWLQQGTALNADLNGDEIVDFSDFSILAVFWFSECPAG